MPPRIIPEINTVIHQNKSCLAFIRKSIKSPLSIQQKLFPRSLIQFLTAVIENFKICPIVCKLQINSLT